MTSGAVASPLEDDVTAAPRASAGRALVVTFGSIVTPSHGLAVRARTTLDTLHRLGFRSTVISHWESDGVRLPSIDELHVLQNPLRLGWSTELVRAVRAHKDRAEVIIVESALLLPAVRAARPRVPIVWDTNECETLHYSRVPSSPVNRLRAFVWKLIESSSVARADVIVAISETEAEWWRRLFPKSRNKLVVVDHCSRANQIAPESARVDLERLCGTQLRGAVLLFVGNLLGKHNAVAAQWLVESLAPLLPSECSLVLAGPGTEAVATRESDAIVCSLGGVTDIDTVVAGADICLAPLAAGAGVKTKVLHYLAHGKRVVATPIALEGIEDPPGVQEAELDDFLGVIIEWISRDENPVARRRREALQRAWVRERYGADRVAEQWREALRTASVTVV
jgi:glycosyltransferase involved in cell wall biosynthesis